MSEKVVLISPSQKVTSTDLTEIGAFARSGIDHLTLDGIGGGTRGYTGFNAIKSAQTKVTVGPGRYHASTGAIFAFESEAGTEIDFLSALPAVSKRIAAIVVGGSAQNTQTEAREFVINTTTGQTEARATSTENWRIATVSYVLGNENATPTPPAVDSNLLVVGFVTLTPTSVDSVEMNDLTRVRSARAAWDRANATGAKVEAFEPKISAIEADVAGVKTDVNGKLAAEFGYRMAFDIAAIKRRMSLPDSYIDYGADTFLDKTDSSTTDTANGYSAKVEEGLRFPPQAINVYNGLALLNPNDENVYKDPSGLILPAWTETRYRMISGVSGQIPLNSVAYDNTSILQAIMITSRVRMGPEFVVSKDWLDGAKLVDPVRLYFERNGETFQLYPDPDFFNPSGVVQYRARKQWQETPTSAYWTANSGAPEIISGFKYAQTFLNSSDRWSTAIGIGGFTRIDTAGGAMVLMLTECTEDDKPNDQRVLAKTTILPNQITGANVYQRFPITPTFLEKGKRYAYVISSAANHYLGIVDSSFPNPPGSMFYKNGNGIWQSDPAKYIVIDLWYAQFKQVRTEIQLGTLTLSGGIAALDILQQAVVPTTAGLTYEVQWNGNWVPLTAENVDNHPFSSPTPPDTLPFRAVFSGGGTVQPGLNLTKTQVTISRPASTLKHFSKMQTILSSSTSIRTKTRIENYTAAKHTVTPKLKVSGGAEISPSVITDRALGNKVIERTAVFSLGTAATQFQRITLASTTSVADPCVITEVGHVAT